jgi:hypothetical protein
MMKYELKSALAVSALMIGSLPLAHAATTYNVAADLFESTAAGGDTTFHATFAWDPATQTILSLSGTMNSSMVDPQPTPPEDIILNGLVTQQTYSENGNNWIVATVYKNGTSSIFKPAAATETQIGAFVFRNSNGIDVSKQVDSGITQNAFATFAFNPTDPTQSNLWLTSYADCTTNGMMMQICMTGHAGPGHTGGGAPAYLGLGTMGAYPSSLSITSTAVPVPAAAWLFGSALMGLFGVGRRQRALNA